MEINTTPSNLFDLGEQTFVLKCLAEATQETVWFAVMKCALIRHRNISLKKKEKMYLRAGTRNDTRQSFSLSAASVCLCPFILCASKIGRTLSADTSEPCSVSLYIFQTQYFTVERRGIGSVHICGKTERLVLCSSPPVWYTESERRLRGEHASDSKKLTPVQSTLEVCVQHRSAKVTLPSPWQDKKLTAALLSSPKRTKGTLSTKTP